MPVTRSSGMLEGTSIDQKYIDLAAQREAYQLVSSELIPPCSGKGFSVDKGQVFRIVQAEGPQIGDVWFQNRDDSNEHFMGHTTFLHEGAYPKQYSQFWSCMPHVRPMATMLLEHSGDPELPENFHNHVVLGGHCTSNQWEMLSGIKDHNSCHANGIEAVKPFGLGEAEILHDNFMVFQPSFIRPDGSGDSVSSQSQPGDYVEFVADMDLIVAVSACPVGDYAVPISEPDKITTRPLGFEIYNTNINT
jgi:uncharacterized protein YcgI (DUF1989 family)